MSSERIALPDLNCLTAEQQRVASEVASGSRGVVRGPVHVWLHSPGLADHAQKLGEFLRTRTNIEPRIRELVILVACRHYDSHFMWFNHVAPAMNAGLSSEIVDDIKNRREPAFSKPDEAAAYALAIEILRDNAVSDSTLATARSFFGERGTIELGALIAHYHSGAIALSLTDIALPDGTKTCLPP